MSTNAWGLRETADAPWSRERERRVLGGALRSFRRRERRKRALEVSAAVLAILFVVRLFPGATSTDTPGKERGSATSPHDHAEPTKGSPPEGLAGTGGHGGRPAGHGFGGSAGTG
jgi:hypothetical protein